MLMRLWTCNAPPYHLCEQVAMLTCLRLAMQFGSSQALTRLVGLLPASSLLPCKRMMTLVFPSGDKVSLFVSVIYVY